MNNKSDNPNRTGFLAHVETIRNAERDVDKLLDAARLQRIESGKKPISPLALAVIVALAFVLCAVLLLGYLSGYFALTLAIVGAVSFIGGIFCLAGVAA